jgi:hypothetical protein
MGLESLGYAALGEAPRVFAGLAGRGHGLVINSSAAKGSLVDARAVPRSTEGGAAVGCLIARCRDWDWSSWAWHWHWHGHWDEGLGTAD